MRKNLEEPGVEPYGAGASMIALIRLEEATVEPRVKPDDLEPDAPLRVNTV